MTKTTIIETHSVGDRGFSFPDTRIFDEADTALNVYMARFLRNSYAPVPEIVTLPKVKVIAAIPFRVLPISGKPAFNYQRVDIGLAKVYKVVRNAERRMGSIGLLAKDDSAFEKIEWPESGPFHDAFDDLSDSSFQVVYVLAVRVGSTFKLLEILDDQTW